MNQTFTSYIRILAIYLNASGFGFAVFEGPDHLIDWGTAHFTAKEQKECLSRIGALMKHYRPSEIVTEHPIKSPHRGDRVRWLLVEIRRLARRNGVPVKGLTRGQVRIFFSQFGAITKEDIARKIAQQLPELEPRLPPRRRPWMSADSRMSIFDAVALGLVWFELG